MVTHIKKPKRNLVMGPRWDPGTKPYWPTAGRKLTSPSTRRHYPAPGGNKYRNLSLQVRGVSKIDIIRYAWDSRSEKNCAGDAQQKLKTTDLASRQRGRLTSTNPQLKIIKERRRKNWSQVPDGCLTPGQTG
jgi:hypothetical protein